MKRMKIAAMTLAVLAIPVLWFTGWYGASFGLCLLAMTWIFSD